MQSGRVLLRADFIPDDETEVYFKAADVLVLPYRHIYQSGVLFLGHSFGLPVLAADVGSLKDDIVEGKTGFVFRPEDPVDLAKTIERYFASDLYAELERPAAGDTGLRYGATFLGRGRPNNHERVCRACFGCLAPEALPNRDASSASVDVKAPHETTSDGSGPSRRKTVHYGNH